MKKTVTDKNHKKCGVIEHISGSPDYLGSPRKENRMTEKQYHIICYIEKQTGLKFKKLRSEEAFVEGVSAQEAYTFIRNHFQEAGIQLKASV